MNFDENNIVSGKLQFQGILDVSFYTIYQSDNMRYKAKINSKPGLPKAIYIIINIFLIIQLIGPCFFVDSSYLWDQNSAFTTFIKYLGCIWQLWAGKSRIHAGIAFSILVFLFELLSGIWAGIISKKQVLRKGENYFSLLSGKYLRPIFTILSFSAFPESIERVKTDKVAITYIILFILIVLIGPFDLFLFSARILVENNPNHEWNQFYPFLSFLVTSILVVLSASVGFLEKSIQAVFMILCAIIYALFAIYIFLTAPTIKRTFSLVISSLSLSGCLVSLVSTIFLFTNEANPALLFLLFIIFFVICYIALTFLNKKKISKIMMIFSQCESSPDEAKEILKQHFKSPNQFISAIQLSFQYWPPFLFTWKPFSIFSQEYPENSNIILLWIRICALFPQEAELFRYLIKQFANLKSQSYSRTSFLTQMLIILSSRNLESTPIIMKNITSISNRIEIAHALQFRFWERILQKSTELFWPNIRSLSKLLDKIDNDILQLISSYPNNKDIVILYCNFLKNVKFDFVKHQEWSEKLKQLRDGIPLQPDIAIQSCRLFLPEVQQYCAESQLKKQEESQSEVIDSKNPDIDFRHHQVKVSLQELISKSRIGSISIGIILLFLGTILTILAFVWYSSNFKGRYIDDPLHKTDFMRSVNNGLFHFAYLANYVALHPMIISGAFRVCSYSNISSSICTNLMNKISKTLYSRGKIIPWTYEPSYPQDIISNLREKLIAIQFALGNLTHSQDAKEMYTDLFIKPFLNDLTPIQALLKCSVDATSILKALSFQDFTNNEIIKEYDHTVNLVANELLKYPTRMIEATINESKEIRIGLDSYFQLTLFAVLILVALPFNMTYYLLRIESGLVTLAFTSLPNTAVREIIQNLNEKNNNNNGNTNHPQNALITTSKNNLSDTLQMYFIFFLSTAMVMACSIYLYYLSFDYSDTLNNNLDKISSFQQPGILTLFITYHLTRASSYDLIPKAIPYITKEHLAAFCNYTQAEQLDIAKSSIDRLHESVKTGIWGPQGTMKSYYQTNLELDYFSNIIPGFTDLANNSGILTVFEELATMDIIQQFDILIKDFYFFITEALASPDLSYIDNRYFLPLVYYGTVFCGIKRFPQFFNSISETIINEFTKLNSTIVGLIVGVAIVQVLSFILISFYLYSKSNLVKKALHMLLFFNPQVILQNQNVMLLLTKRSMKNFEDESSYLDAEKVIENTDEGAVLIDKKTVITDVNNSFLNCVEQPKEKVVGKLISDVLKAAPNQQSIQVILLKLSEVFKGNVSPTFKEKITIVIPNGKEKDVFVNVICLTSNGTATESNFNEICGIAFIIDDQTEQRRIEQKISDENKKITDMLNKVLPKSVIDELQKGSDSISLSVQSATIGCIEVCSTKTFDPNDFNAPFKFLSTVFNALDEIIEDFPQLTKIRTNSFTYEYAGGLFGSINKPDKHAEEATRFALKILSSARQIGQKVGSNVEFKIGLSTGGPLVAGLISLNKPNFHLIGPTVDLAQRMKSSCILNQVQVTRAVYELVYAYNFNVVERGDIDTGGGIVLRTYVINP